MNRSVALRGGALALMVAIGFVAGAWVDQAYPEWVPYLGHRSASRVDLTGVQEAARLIQADSVDSPVDTKKLAQGSIQGVEGSKVTLTILRGAETMTVTIARAQIQVPTVRSATVGNHVLYVRIYMFGDKTSSEFSSALTSGLPGSSGMVLDLRGDPGGFVSAADDVISQFVTSGETFETRGRSGTNKHQVGSQHGAASIPLVVLVDANSASAAEIVAGSLQVHHRAKLVGTTTFGKGSVQEDFVLSDGSDIHLTIKRWYLPNGETIDKKGLQPDVTVPLANVADQFDVLQPADGYSKDAQLNAALNVLAGG